MVKKKCDKKRWAFAGAILWGGAVFILGILATLVGYGELVVTLLGSIYLGYNATFFGTCIGTVWAMIDAFIGIWIFLWLYEKLPKK